MNNTIWILYGLSGGKGEYAKMFWFSRPSIDDLINAGVSTFKAKELLGLYDPEEILDAGLSQYWTLKKVAEGEIIC